ncbi:MAG: hypothetical protein PHQ59_01880 [Candidatus Daviesbacteria bacterium]|nr:hypothetical protein [Candidatus Daviesbacteria bacterium]
MKSLGQNIQIKQLLPVQTLADSANGSAVDTQENVGSHFDTALVNVEIGNLGSQATTKVKIEESDSSTFATGNTVAPGGAEITVAQDTSYKMEIERTKRYLRAVVTMTTPGATPSAEIFIGAILWNAQKPFPVV